MPEEQCASLGIDDKGGGGEVLMHEDERNKRMRWSAIHGIDKAFMRISVPC